jgi:long-chain acyl-CoA synthetase
LWTSSSGRRQPVARTRATWQRRGRERQPRRADGRAVALGGAASRGRGRRRAVSHLGAARGRGGAPGDRVALFADNCPEYLEALFAIWHAGAIAVPISSRLHPREAAAIAADAGAELCFVTANLAEGLAACAPEAAPAARASTAVGEAHEAGGSAPLRLVAFGDADDRALLAGEPVAPAPRRADDPAWIFFTSGTTGRPKGALLTHGNLLAMAAAFHADVDPVSPRDTLVHVAALSHASGLIGLPFVARGALQLLPASGGFDAGELLGLVAAGERSTFFVPPTLLRRLSADPRVGETPVERLGTILVGAAPVLPGDLRDGVAAFGPRLWNGYGQGESPCTITALGPAEIAAAVAEDDEAALRSVGVARWATRVRVVGQDDRELPPGEVGEVVVDGPTVMAGYLDRPDATAETLRGGWLHTGDLGAFDGHGTLTLVDRAKDVVISGGYNVYPREVEDVLITDPAVAEAAVVGLPDPEWGERVVAYVVAAPDAVVDDTALDRRCLEAIARHKRPKEYRVVDALPRNAAGKVLKKQLREELADVPR